MTNEKLQDINRVINHLGIRFRDDDHKKKVIEYFERLTRVEMLRPLIIEDKKTMSYQQICNKYGISKGTVEYHVVNEAMFMNN